MFVVFDLVVAMIVTSFPICNYYMRFARKYQYIARDLTALAVRKTVRQNQKGYVRQRRG